ncbi:fibronectin type III domain-containing protein [Nonomuraea sp. NPDC004580]|uniref:fibronectin type III domain-containing protein n=1 Tax=Nonomuraea sp. NPDC004580 TaxID=3154552 RepID=UPI0033BCF5D8
MPVNEKLMELGSWSFELIDETPKTVVDAISYFGHVAFIPGKVNPAEYGDELLDMARYVGVVTGKSVDHIRKVISGQGMALWLADSDGKGDLIESPITITGQTFPNAIRAILGSGTAVVEGTLHSGVAGTYTGTHVYQSRAKAINFICSTMGAEWRVNGRAELDAGPAEALYNGTPDTVIVKRRPNRHTDGDDLALHGLRGDMGLAQDVKDWTTRVVLLAEGQGDAVATASADIAANPYLDMRGEPVKRVRVVSESTTAAGSAQARANAQLARFVEPRSALTLTTDDYDVSGAFSIGDWAWVWDPDAGLVDPDVEVMFRGERINPIKLRMVGASWPVRPGTTVAFRAQDGSWLDLTPYVAREGGETTVTVGDLLRALSDSSVEPVGPRPIPDSTVPGQVSWHSPFESGVYLAADGSTRAKMLVKWLLPLNVDGSTILDGDHYEIGYGVSPVSGEEWQIAYAAWGDLQQMIYDLSPGIDYDFRIRAVDTSGNQGEWSEVAAEQTNPDTIPPSTPAPPSVAGSLIAIQIVHELGKASGGTYNLELDLDHLEVHVGSSSGFTPSDATLKGQVMANAGMIAAEIPAVGTVDVEETTTRYVKVIAVDQAGNKSSPSTAATATAELIDDAHISDLTVTKVTAGTISSNWIIGASIRTASSGQRVELNASGLHGYNSGGTELVTLSNTGSFTLRSATSGARINLTNGSGLELYNSSGTRTVHLDSDGSFELRSAASGARIQIDGTGIKAYNSSGQQTVDIASSTGNATFVGQLATGFSGRRVVVDPSTNDIKFYSSTGSSPARILEYATYPGVGSLQLISGTATSPERFSYLALQPNRADISVTNFSSIGGFVSRIIMSETEFAFQTNLGGSSHYLEYNIGGGWWVDGSPLKSFIIDHPTDPDRYLIHACTESPQAGVEYWGDVVLDGNGQAVVELPEYFEALTRPDGRYVSVNTCSDEIRNASATYPQNGRFTIHGAPGVRVTWLVKATRADAGDMLIEPRRDQITVHGDGPYRYYTLKEPRA